MKRITQLLTLLLALCLLLTAMSCGAPESEEDRTHAESVPAAGTSGNPTANTEAPTETPTEAETDTPIALSPGYSSLTDDEKAIRNALMDYYLAMFKDVAADGSENVLFSPLSVFAATAMTAEGAKGQTLAELEALMGISQADLSAAYRLCLGENGESSALLSANSLWIDTDEGLTVNEATMEKIKNQYAAGFFHQDLQAPETVGQVNQWISEHTKGRIPHMMDEISEYTKLMLVNALSFDAKWQKGYTEDRQQEGEFTQANGTPQPVTMLTGSEDYYLFDDHAQGFYKLYKTSGDSKTYAFCAILPNEGMTPTEYLATLDGDGLRNMIFNYNRDVILRTRLPVFSADTSYVLNETYQALGCPTPFGGTADFTGLATYNGSSLYISSIMHKATIKVDALGTEAGAATVTSTLGSGAILSPQPVVIREVYLDRPFIYMIVDCDTGLPVFMGITASIA